MGQSDWQAWGGLMKPKTFEEYGIEIPHGGSGNVYTTCPRCSKDRKKKTARCLSVHLEDHVWNCHHCGWSGGLAEGEHRSNGNHWARPEFRKPAPIAETPSEGMVAWFAKRGIPSDVLKRNRIVTASVYMPQMEEHVNAVAFPYYRAEELINCKYRDKDKNFRLEVGAERTLYGLNDLAETTIVVEGEVDKLSMEAAGMLNCVSVPDGAPAPNSKDYSSKFDFLNADAERLQVVRKWIIAVDNDPAGLRLEDELARRLGREVCFRVVWPEGCKDANDVLRKHSAQVLRECVANAKPYPITGVFEVMDISDRISTLYSRGWELGVSTGWKDVDKYYTVRPGELTVITGIPNSGKSVWLDCLVVNIAELHGWNFGVFSPENQPLEDHMSRIIEKFIGKPFGRGVHQRMSEEELNIGKQWAHDHFRWILPEDDESWTLENILDAGRQLVRRHGIRGLIIDPWNELEHQRPERMSETEYISLSLKRIRQFARINGVHVWLVAHPTKMYRDKNGEYPIPTLYDISGCYSSDTEVLTKRGWLKHAEISVEDEVACFNTILGSMEYHKPSRIIRKPYVGPMHNFKGYGYDLLVTPEHRMVVMPDWKEPNGRQTTTGFGRPVRFPKGKWQFCEAEKLPTSNFKIPLTATLRDQSTEEISESLARLAGWYVSEGCGSTSSSVSISQAVGEKSDQIAALLISMSIPFSVYKSLPGGKGGTLPMNSFYIHMPGASEIVNWLKRECGVGSANVRIPEVIFRCSNSVKAAFLETYLAGDGSLCRVGAFRATTISRMLRDGLQRLALELGLPSSWHINQRKENTLHSESWTVSIGRAARKTTSIRTPYNRTFQDYSGEVWCLTVPTGAYFTRRNGKAVVCGNSAHFRNKCDNGICVWRSFADNDLVVQLHVQKVRFRQIGRIGMAELSYNRVTQTYHRPQDAVKEIPPQYEDEVFLSEHYLPERGGIH
jgi:twinkle protein